MNSAELKIRKWSKTKVLRSLAVFAIPTILVPTLGFARQMECSYDYITHLTTLQLDDLGVENGPILYRYIHSVSPIGGEEMYLFRGDDPVLRQGTKQLEFIFEKLYFDPLSTWRTIAFVDFERPTFKELQAPAAFMEQSIDTINAPLVVWSCHRKD